MDQYSPRGFRVLPPVIKNLLIINGLFFLATIMAEKVYGLDLNNILGLHYFESRFFQPYQFVTYMFMHGGLTHIVFNMFALWMFGNVLEEVWGPKKFLIFYFVCGIGAALTQMFVQYIDIHNLEAILSAKGIDVRMIQRASEESMNQLLRTLPLKYDVSPQSLINLYQKINSPTIGASGAVFGILLAFGMMFPNSLLYIYFLFPIKAKYFVIFYAAIELFSGFSSNDNVAHFAHLGGMIFGFFLIRYWRKDQFDRFN